MFCVLPLKSGIVNEIVKESAESPKGAVMFLRFSFSIR